MLLPRCIPALQNCIKDIDQAYDACNEAWARGEADKFRSKEFLTSKLDIYSESSCNPSWWLIPPWLHKRFRTKYMVLHFLTSALVLLDSTNISHAVMVRFVQMAEEQMKKATFTRTPQFISFCCISRHCRSLHTCMQYLKLMMAYIYKYIVSCMIAAVLRCSKALAVENKVRCFSFFILSRFHC